MSAVSTLQPVIYNRRCWLAHHGIYERGQMPRCSGRLVKAHLIRRQVIERECSKDVAEVAVWADGAWVWACGGLSYGNGGHHGDFDHSRTLKVQRAALPEATERLAARLGLGWWLDREYGPL